MHLEDDPRRGARGALVVLPVRSVGGADLDEPGARPRHDVGDAERAADLHQLAAGHDRLAVARQGREGDEQRPRRVVHDQRVFGAGELEQQIAAERVA